MASLRNYFERVVIISLAHRPERAARALSHLEQCGMAGNGEVSVMRAWPGDSGPGPAWWKAGNGAWGCLMSHVRAVQDALMDGVENVLILEDDVFFHPRAPGWLEKLMCGLPEWDQLYLGGQHLKEAIPLPENPHIWQARNINRTHAYALHRRVYARFLQHVLHAPDYQRRGGWHIDHQLGTAHERGDWRVYAPAWWLCAQEEGSSNISGKHNPRLWWQPFIYADRLPFIRLTSGDGGTWLHRGEAFPGAALGQKWLKQTATRALDRWQLPAAPPELSDAELRRLWPAGVREATAEELPVLCDYPENGLFPHPLTRVIPLPPALRPGFSA